ncbi:MAG: tRNA (adenosine(37)-N6)-threonylcarbamoyltransferase complex dimerization subunit type 1 TsaB, partial [Anaerococcus sp.]|nr:tRNA (adenosine(37)-N6)-threonylcarbamoyltransferase complex dimerization subunit type 1 TsaB [Anaerococcus sp.]
SYFERYLYTIEDFSKLVNDLDEEIELIGDISLKYEDLFEKAKVLPINFRNTIGKSLIKLALENKNDYDLYQLVPNYLRKSQAERELLRNDQKNGN